jgi:hypothetical protein
MHGPRNLWNFGNPSTVGFAFDFKIESHMAASVALWWRAAFHGYTGKCGDEQVKDTPFSFSIYQYSFEQPVKPRCAIASSIPSYLFLWR